MTLRQKENRPAGNGAASREQNLGDKVRPQSTEPTPAAAPNTLATWPWARWDDYLTGYIAGRADGITEGRRQADAEAAARHQAAADVVLAMTRVPVRDKAADAARRARWDARFGGGQ